MNICKRLAATPIANDEGKYSDDTIDHMMIPNIEEG